MKDAALGASQDVRGRIIEAADRLFYQKGYDATSISDIISAASVSRAGFYGNFQSKQELANRYLDLSVIRMGDMLHRIAGRSHTPEAFIKSWFSLLMRQVRNRQSNGCPLANFSSGRDSYANPWQSNQRRALDYWQSMLLEFLEKWTAQGQFKTAEQLSIVARKILILYEGALTLWKIDGDVANLESGMDLTLGYLQQIRQ